MRATLLPWTAIAGFSRIMVRFHVPFTVDMPCRIDISLLVRATRDVGSPARVCAIHFDEPINHVSELGFVLNLALLTAFAYNFPFPVGGTIANDALLYLAATWSRLADSLLPAAPPPEQPGWINCIHGIAQKIFVGTVKKLHGIL
jgi:hypothetical protein